MFTQEMDMECPDCQSKNFTVRTKLIPFNRTQHVYADPKFIPQIKQECADCGRYIKFMKQTPELIERINKGEGIDV